MSVIVKGAYVSDLRLQVGLQKNPASGEFLLLTCPAVKEWQIFVQLESASGIFTRLPNYPKTQF